MLAMLVILVGVVMVAIGVRGAGDPGGFAVDRSGMLRTAQPAVRGTMRGALGWLGGAVLQIFGYVLAMVGLMMLL